MKEQIRSTKAISMTAIITTALVAVVGLFSLTVAQMAATQGSVIIKTDTVFREIELDFLMRQIPDSEEEQAASFEQKEKKY